LGGKDREKENVGEGDEKRRVPEQALPLILAQNRKPRQFISGGLEEKAGKRWVEG